MGDDSDGDGMAMTCSDGGMDEDGGGARRVVMEMGVCNGNRWISVDCEI